MFFFFFQAEDGIRDYKVTGVQTCALPICGSPGVHVMTFDRNARAALADGQLRDALRQATTLFGERRRAALATAPDWEGARDRARAIKDETLLHLDRYLEEFSANAERAGARVHWARDAAEACEVIGRIAD